MNFRKSGWINDESLKRWMEWINMNLRKSGWIIMDGSLKGWNG